MASLPISMDSKEAIKAPKIMIKLEHRLKCLLQSFTSLSYHDLSSAANVFYYVVLSDG